MFVLTKSKGGGAAGALPPGLAITVINGQPMLTLEDTTRGDKILSIAEQPLVFEKNQLKHLDWLRIGTSNNALSGFIADFDGTVVYVSGHCENTGAATKDIHMYINGVDQGVIGNFSGGADATIQDDTLDFDFVIGDKIRLQAEDEVVPLPGDIQDTVVKLTIKWRG